MKGDEVTIPIEDFNPCVTDYAPPYRTQPGRYSVGTYYPGRVWLKISHYGEDYILHIDTEQCRKLNTVLSTDYNKPKIDWCGGRVVKDMGKLGRIERPSLAC
ncbi:hypothetical protein [Vulcanisaeta sp. JCM 16159]|uniref:hypothetical protein n=1 Tax=Vulcanisaeta sp. JCM 16159 TaxID=1295371 RepID=UPI0006D1AAE2|nr:hypothetical protein [Vulcanisaeta sp. JCM 16159]